MDRLVAAKVFVETVERGSISAAAGYLGMSRAMASRYISLMEKWCKNRLLHRTTRQLSLTAAGERVLRICKELLALSIEVSAVSELTEVSPGGTIKITASSILADFGLASAISDFLKIYPSVSIDLHIVDKVVNLAAEGIDLAIRGAKDLEPGLIARKLGVCPLVVCASPEYLKDFGVPSHPNDLVNHNCLIHAHSDCKVWTFTRDDEKIDIHVSGNFFTNESLIFLKSALEGLGIVMMPIFAVKNAIEEGRLIHLFSSYECSTLSFFAVYLSREHMPLALRLIIDFLGERLQSLIFCPPELEVVASAS